MGLEAAEVAAAERKRRDADETVAAPAIAALPYPYAAGLNLAGLPIAGAPLNYAGLAGLPALTYAAAPAVAAPAVAAPAVAAVAAPVAYAGAPAREATLTTIKLNPGHATFYRV